MTTTTRSDYNLGLSAVITDLAFERSDLSSPIETIRETKRFMVNRVNEILTLVGEEPIARTARFTSSAHHVDGLTHFALMLPVTEDVFARARESL